MPKVWFFMGRLLSARALRGVPPALRRDTYIALPAGNSNPLNPPKNRRKDSLIHQFRPMCGKGFLIHARKDFLQNFFRPPPATARRLYPQGGIKPLPMIAKRPRPTLA